MLNTLGRNLNSCFTKKITAKPITSSSDDSSLIFQNHPLNNSLPFLKTFNSLFDLSPSSPTDTTTLSPSSPSDTPDFATAVASRRFFFSSPGRSNSIVDSSSDVVTGDSPETLPTEKEEAAVAKLGDGGVAVQRYSPDPYGDFRRSMEEMVDALGLHDVRERWEELHDLLTCYLNLNPKPTHNLIFAAFADLLVSLLHS